ncbi:hypothetical protein CoNPh28_CDS0002 [Staphylococcus phage S-CoN_Ph28]|nr:hypothetical protein CoNPh28_CDS0002 [Staphylococcus phage S-CoN_Ph28]
MFCFFICWFFFNDFSSSAILFYTSLFLKYVSKFLLDYIIT